MGHPHPHQTLDDVARTQIKTWIASTGITQTALALRIGRNQAWMSRYLSGDIEADLETLNRMAAVFGHTLTSALNIPTDPTEATVIQLYRSLTLEARRLVVQMLEEWARPRYRGRSRR